MSDEEIPAGRSLYLGPVSGARTKQQFGNCLWRERVGQEFVEGAAQREKRALPAGNSKAWYWEQGYRLPQNESALRVHLHYLRVQAALMPMWVKAWKDVGKAEKAARRSASAVESRSDPDRGPMPPTSENSSSAWSADIQSDRQPYERHRDAFLRHLIAAAEFVDVQRGIDRGRIDTRRVPDFEERKQRYERSVMEIYLVAGSAIGPLVAAAQDAIIRPPGLAAPTTAEQINTWGAECHLRLAKVRAAMSELLSTELPPDQRDRPPESD